jgi:hypothetical protein
MYFEFSVENCLIWANCPSHCQSVSHPGPVYSPARRLSAETIIKTSAKTVIPPHVTRGQEKYVEGRRKRKAKGKANTGRCVADVQAHRTLIQKQTLRIS